MSHVRRTIVVMTTFDGDNIAQPPSATPKLARVFQLDEDPPPTPTSLFRRVMSIFAKRPAPPTSRASFVEIS